MPHAALTERPRCAVVDLGSNSVRLVVFEGLGRTPTVVFNEKAVLRLGRGLLATGRLNEEGVAQALTVMRRYHAIARGMRARPFEVLATAAVRDARNGAEFVAELQEKLLDIPVHILSGEQEAALSAAGLLCGIPDADGVLADIGGGSLELVRLVAGHTGEARTLPLGLIRLSERAEGDPVQARAIAEADLATVPWLAGGEGLNLYLVGGAWRAVARMHMVQSNYLLNIVDQYTMGREAARSFTGELAAASRRMLERMPGVPRRRLDDLPFAAIVLRRLLRATGAARVVFSASGLREGWYMKQVAANVRGLDPLLSAAVQYARQLGRNPDLPPLLFDWTGPLFPHEREEGRRLREAACWLSDIGSYEHPEYRAEQTFLRVFHQPGVGMDHRARAFLALAVGVRYEAEPEMSFVQPACQLLAHDDVRRAVILGCALRLAYTLSGGTPDLLAVSRLRVEGALTLELESDSGVFAGESVTRRMERLAAAIGLAALDPMI